MIVSLAKAGGSSSKTLIKLYKLLLNMWKIKTGHNVRICEHLVYVFYFVFK